MFKRNDYEELEEYKWDNFIRMNQKIKKVEKVIFGITIIIILLIILSSIISIKKTSITQIIKASIKGDYDINITEEKPIKVNLLGNGFYSLKIENVPDLEVHIVIIEGQDIFIKDICDRLHKYYFEKWNDNDKYKFIIDEKYEDYQYGLTTKKNWFLSYKTYIDVNNFEEMMNATDAIIRFKKFMGNYSSMPINSYIRIDNELILPHNVSLQSYESIKESAIMQYIQIVKKKNLNFTDIPKEIINKYLNN